MITKQKARKSLKTPDETVTVNFIPQQSNIKKLFPVTHARLLKDEDLSSPGESEDDDEDGAKGRVDSSGFEKLDIETFEKFGENVIKEKEREGEDEEKKEKREEGEVSVAKVDSVKEEEDIEREATEEDLNEEAEDGKERSQEEIEAQNLTHFEEVDTGTTEDMISTTRKKVERAVSLDMVKPLEPTPLKKWEDIQNLKQMEESGEEILPKEDKEEKDDEGGQQLETVPEEEEEEEDSSKTLENVAVMEESGLKPERVGGGEGGGQGTGVLKRVTQIEGQRPWPQDTGGDGGGAGGVRGKGLERVKSGSVSEKLKMFGGGRVVIRPVSTSAAVKTKPSRLASDTPRGKRTNDDEDEIAPLPNIDKKTSRRNSEEKLRMDGLPSLSPPPQRVNKPPPTSPLPGSPPLSRLAEVAEVDETAEEEKECARVSPTPSPAQLRRKNSTGVYSPLMISKDASDTRCKSENLEKKTEQESRLSQPLVTPVTKSLEVAIKDEKRWSLRDEKARRQLFALSIEGKVGSRESAYMGWASPPQLGQMRQRWEKEAGESVRMRVAGLLRTARLTGPQVPLELRGLQPREPGRLSLWRQKVW